MTKAEHCLSQMMNAGVEADAKIYSTMIEAYAEVGNAAKAEHWLSRMIQEKGICANTSTYNAVIKAYTAF